MPRKPSHEKEIAFSLWANGHSLKYVRKQLNGTVTDKSIYKWFEDFKYANPDYRERLDDYDIELSSAEIIENHNDWLKRAIENTDEIATQNRAIRLQLQEKLLIELNKTYDDINFRKINLMVNSLCSIQKNEFIVNGLHLLDINKAIALLDSQGYAVVEK